MNYKHGLKNTRLYRIWNGIKSRCFIPSHSKYEYYGGRGITVCPEWKDDFKAFYDWAMSNGYQDNLTIDRIDCNGNYEPSNCRWVTMKVQQNNSSHCHYVEFNGQIHSIAEWARITGIPRSTLNNRINCYGWTVEEALTRQKRNVKRGKKNDLFEEVN